MAEEERRSAVAALELSHGRAALDAIVAEANPVAAQLEGELAQCEALAAQSAALEAEAAAADASTALFGELVEHFGKRGVQNLLYTLALSQLEAAAAVYTGELSSGRLQLRLAFDEQLRSVRKHVRVRRPDGSFAERSIAQLSGGEWRRVGLGLSLAFADFAKQRSGLSCNLLVLDEVMQHMDVDGQAAMARVLRGLGVETTVVIAHGLASDALYGDFDAMDVVWRDAKGRSSVRVT